MPWSGVLCLLHTDKHMVVWKKVGESITIQCKDSSGQENLEVKRGLEEKTILATSRSSPSKNTICQNLTSRIQTHGTFPNVAILIKNLSAEDTGPYWCLYSTSNHESGIEFIKGQGSLLLVVTGKSFFIVIINCYNEKYLFVSNKS